MFNINDNGNVQVNNALSTYAKINVKQTNNQIYSGLAVYSTDGTETFIGIGNIGSAVGLEATYGSTGSYVPMIFKTGGLERMRISNAGVKFQNGSSSLNYYEEGTFTPTNLNSNMSAVTPEWGRYVRIGNQVTINVRWTVNPGGTGQKYIVFNLPFAFSISNGVSYTGAVSNYNSGLTSGSSNVGTSVRNSSSSDTQQYVEAVFVSNTTTTILFSMTYFTF